jgi:hypothetical protein
MGHLDIALGGSAFSLGGEAAWLQYGRQKQRILFGPTVAPDPDDLTLDVETLHAMVTLHGRVRVQPRKGKWRPYVDGLYGFMSIFTQTTIDDDEFERKTEARDFVRSVGGGAGVMMRARPGNLPMLDIGIRYLRGGPARYLTEDGVRQEGSQVIGEMKSSRTDMFTVYVGMAFGR